MNKILNYNGWSTRSTWAAALHLGNTSEEVYKRTRELARKYEALHEDRAQWVGINYPVHQLQALEKEVQTLLKETGFYEEEAVKFSNVNIAEILAYFEN